MGKNCYLLLSGSLSRRQAKTVRFLLLPCVIGENVCATSGSFYSRSATFPFQCKTEIKEGERTRAGRACLGIHAARLMKSTARQCPRKESPSLRICASTKECWRSKPRTERRKISYSNRIQMALAVTIKLVRLLLKLLLPSLKQERLPKELPYTHTNANLFPW